MTLCGAVQSTPLTDQVRLVCEREIGHDGPHGLFACGFLFTRWTDGHVEQPGKRHTDGWRKPHVRRKYQTLKTWKRERGL